MHAYRPAARAAGLAYDMLSADRVASVKHVYSLYCLYRVRVRGALFNFGLSGQYQK